MTCSATLSGATAEEMVANGMKHVTEVHPDMAASIKAMTKEESEKWMTNFKPKFDVAPEA